MDEQQDYNQMLPYSSQEIKDEENQKDNKYCFHFWCWFLQLMVWGFLIVSIVLYCIENSIYIITFPIYGFFHLIYIILELFSPTGKFLWNKKTKEGIKETLRKYFTTNPLIQFYCECYHIEIEYHTTTDEDGNTETYTTETEVVTYRETYNMPYYSERDVSGLFHLNCEKDEIQKKRYIKLRLGEEINLADAISYLDYENEKNNFDKRNKHRDACYRFRETRNIQGLIKHNLIKVGDSDPCIVNYWMFLLFIFLTFAEFYKSYVNSLCINQKFKIRKLVSTRYNLSQPICNEKYFKFNPQLDLISQTYIYEPQDFNYLSDKYKPKLPTQEEIQAAMKFQNKPGVILDLLGVDDDTNNVKDNKDIYTYEENEKDDNPGINIQMVENNLQENLNQ